MNATIWDWSLRYRSFTPKTLNVSVNILMQVYNTGDCFTNSSQNSSPNVHHTFVHMPRHHCCRGMWTIVCFFSSSSSSSSMVIRKVAIKVWHTQIWIWRAKSLNETWPWPRHQWSPLYTPKHHGRHDNYVNNYAGHNIVILNITHYNDNLLVHRLWNGMPSLRLSHNLFIILLLSKIVVHINNKKHGCSNIDWLIGFNVVLDTERPNTTKAQ